MSKLSYEDKVNLYNDKIKGIAIKSLGPKYGITYHNAQYLIRLIDKHGFDILRTTKNKTYSSFEKERIINRVLLNNESIMSVSINEGLPSDGMLCNWILKYKENGYNIVERKRGRPTMPKVTKKKENETDKEKIKRLEEENLYLKAEPRILKKIESRCSSKEESTTEEKVNVVSELRLIYPLAILLKVSGLAKSVYYYTLSKIDKDDKNKEIIDKIKEIFINNKERYGYRRITLELRNQGYNVNNKKVYRIMVKLGLKPLKRNKRKYSSYKGTVGKIADNLIERDFNADKPNKKWYTDVTEFNLRGEKIYLSPILDGFNGEVISYNTSKSPNLEQINDMLNKAFDGRSLEGLIFHSDQGWQYQHQSYQQRLKNKGIKQSMSRKGNSMDNGMMENFFGLLKTEMFYDQEDKYKNIDELIVAIDDYINYYNYDRIKVKLKGLSPVNYRLQSSN
ncbi:MULTISPECIES: IS3 family transposase [Thomasclavelia]|nr:MULTISPECIES: IS3 family transposase [Thomasclavelia]MCB5406075.1 IS3 family transposase [Thomasclavelia ramosa]MCB6555408.1 IS3 family transposase [Thomasclavelia ramosa]MDU2204517.1 IS3 family transposase [Thomasclavelia ramosa]MDU4087933.1 IS3 family transposase [Thomasclavelia ramosa]